jgi:hypothetical protein
MSHYGMDDHQKKPALTMAHLRDFQCWSYQIVFSIGFPIFNIIRMVKQMVAIKNQKLGFGQYVQETWWFIQDTRGWL